MDSVCDLDACFIDQYAGMSKYVQFDHNCVIACRIGMQFFDANNNASNCRRINWSDHEAPESSDFDPGPE